MTFRKSAWNRKSLIHCLCFTLHTDRYYGQNDPVAAKIFDKAASMPKLEPPADKTIMTLYIGGLAAGTTEQDLRCVAVARPML